MDLDHRPHFRTGHYSNNTATNELFICFTSRLSSSSSMKLTKSILSPGRAARDGPISLSHRLRSNGSLKGGTSPFPAATTGRKRGGGGFENPEPSSPKVTCIGQVRVKTKKKVKRTQSLSRRRSGEVSFRKAEQQSTADNNKNNGGDKERDKMSSQQAAQIRHSNTGGAHYHHHHQQQQQQPAQECLPHRNQRWVHLPISICEALREFSCLFPCKSSCFSRDKAENKQNGSSENGCGAVFARWFVSVNDGEGGKTREIELVVGGGDDEEDMASPARVSMRSSRRHVFENIEVKDDRIEIKGSDGEDEKARVSICIPPKNALLLMRCRSDPMKMASLANRFSWDPQGVCENVCESLEEEKHEISVQLMGCEGETTLVQNDEQPEEISDEADQGILEIMEVGDELLVISSDVMVEEKETEELQQEIVTDDDKLLEKYGNDDDEEDEEEVESNMSSFEALLDQGIAEDHYEASQINQEDEVNDSSAICHLCPETEIESNVEEEEEALMEKENEATEQELDTVTEKDSIFENDDEEDNRFKPAQVEPGPEITQQEGGHENPDTVNPEDQDLLTENVNEEPEKVKDSPILPDCLLLMMCEPKLSMEVSKETWVCSTDFVRWTPEPAKAGKDSGGVQEHVKRRISTDSKLNRPPTRINNAHQQNPPPRSSCSLPPAVAAASMAAMLEQKLVNAVGYEPFVLTRCKSEPMRTAAAKLMPESFFWKNAVRKMEPHRRAALGVGPTGVGV